MSVTISDLLKLPSLYNAEVVAGSAGIDKIISSVSVLETINAELIDSRVYPNDDLGGSEIVITSFVNAADDEEIQFQNVRHLAESGEAGIIIYYVGVFVKEISKKIIDYADQNDFVVICMPKNQPNLRYSDAISDIMMAIFKDKDKNENMVVTLLDTIGRLPAYRQNIGTVVKLLSEYLRMTVILTDSKLNPLYEAAWPGEYAGIHQSINKDTIPSYKEEIREFSVIPKGLIHHKWINAENNSVELFVISIGTKLSEEKLKQAAETIRISLNIWSQKQEGAGISELVRAILEDDPMRMRSLASLFHIDIQSINTMIIFRGTGLSVNQSKQLADMVSMRSDTVFADVYDKNIVLFMSGVTNKQDVRDIYDYAAGLLPDDMVMSLFTNLETTMEVRKAWLLSRERLADLMKILPDRDYYTGGDYKFAEECRKIIDSGEEKTAAVLYPLRFFSKTRDQQIMLETLGVYLLDADMSLIRTSEKMIVHKNTIKYRLKTMSDCMGFQIGEMPATYEIYQAIAIKRLLDT